MNVGDAGGLTGECESGGTDGPGACDEGDALGEGMDGGMCEEGLDVALATGGVVVQWQQLENKSGTSLSQASIAAQNKSGSERKREHVYPAYCA